MSGKRASGLKRIEAFIREEKIQEVLSTLNKMKVAATFNDSKGIGTGEKYQIRYGRRGEMATMAYSNRRTIVTIVGKDQLDAVIAAIKDSAKIDKKGAGGVIAISDVDEFITI